MTPRAQLSRPPLERMLRIHDELRRGSLVNCTKLVKDLEVCRKTIVRDITFMRDRLSLPIAYDAGIQAYRYTHPVSAFPTVQVTEGELLALLVARRALEQYRGTPFHRQLEIAFEKLAGGLRDKINRPAVAAKRFRFVSPLERFKLKCSRKRTQRTQKIAG